MKFWELLVVLFIAALVIGVVLFVVFIIGLFAVTGPLGCFILLGIAAVGFILFILLVASSIGQPYAWYNLALTRLFAPV